MIENWKNVKKFPGYFVSDQGRVSSTRRGYFKVLVIASNADNYGVVTLYNKRRQLTVSVHLLVANHFLGRKPTEVHEVNHINGIKLDNRLENLEWMTPSENTKHTFKLGRIPLKGSLHGNSKLNESKILEIREMLKQGFSQEKIGKLFRVHRATVGYIKRRQTWSHV